ncbi:hypothetical protein chiPu_0021571 [Chiloscyllium punctatum]|uniref:Uncharacterized protein n=1 Tax=Chiloscyllium punctatum TaxID=137246 RepID=A0A401RHT5_CHIPU|nr:hypothetical protein [Chiloscyllium punctatum]
MPVSRRRQHPQLQWPFPKSIKLRVNRSSRHSAPAQPGPAPGPSRAEGPHRDQEFAPSWLWRTGDRTVRSAIPNKELQSNRRNTGLLAQPAE